MAGSAVWVVVGIGFWTFVAIVAVASIWDGVRKRDAQHETLRRLAAGGQPVDPAQLAALLAPGGGTPVRLDRILRVAGVVTLSAAPGLALLGVFLNLLQPGWLFALLGVAALFGCLGAGLLAAARMAER